MACESLKGYLKDRGRGSKGEHVSRNKCIYYRRRGRHQCTPIRKKRDLLPEEKKGGLASSMHPEKKNHPRGECG